MAFHIISIICIVVTSVVVCDGSDAFAFGTHVSECARSKGAAGWIGSVDCAIDHVSTDAGCYDIDCSMITTRIRTYCTITTTITTITITITMTSTKTIISAMLVNSYITVTVPVTVSIMIIARAGM
jgi:hypothetical protein